MFPALQCTFTGLQQDRQYSIFVEMVLVDNYNLKYTTERTWLGVGPAKQCPKGICSLLTRFTTTYQIGPPLSCAPLPPLANLFFSLPTIDSG